jgi:hypothetical protein
MQSSFSILRLIGLSAVLATVPFSVRAQDNTDDDWNHFGLNFRSAFNIRAKFSDPSSISFPPGPGTGSALDRHYDDGYVNVDSSGNQGGLTWNWGYQHASQVSGDNLLMHASGLEGASEHTTGDPNLGFDYNYVRDLGHYGWGQWGIKVAFGYTHVQVGDNDPMSANLETITDKYALGGVTPPMAPYSGSFSGPGPVIGSEPISRSTVITPDGVITGNRNVDASLFDLRLGPSFNIPLFNRFSLQAGGGLAVGLVDSDFTFNETTTTSGGPVSAYGSSSRTGFLVGAYAEAGFAYRVSRSISLFTGAQFQYLGNFEQTSDGRSAQLDFGRTIFFELGLQWQF